MVVTGALSLEVFATAIADVAFVFLIIMTLKSGPATFGVLTALWAAGMLVGAALAERIIGCRIGLAAFGTAAIMGATMLLIGLARSEEHTSELQSLMRFSYAVFCLKTKPR